MSKTVLITGTAGFVGHHMVEHLLKNTGWNIIGVDALTYAGTWNRLRDVDIERPIGDAPVKREGEDFNEDLVSAYDHPRFTPLAYDIRQPAEPNLLKELKDVTHVIHMAAESHVDNSIEDPVKFTKTNVEGTVNMLNLARELPNLELFLYFSTDEVFGPAPMEIRSLPQGESPGKGWVMTLDDTKGNAYTYKGGLNEYYSDWKFKGYSEDDKHDPKNPYAASKSAAEMMVVAFANTYKLPCIITRQMNIFGERQHPEKFIPICIRKALYGGDINIHASADKSKAGMRHYIHARNVADAHLHLLNEKPWLRNTGFPREVESYHIVGELEVDNLTLARTINEYTGYIAEELKMVPEGVTNFNMVDFHSSRPGHDLRYALDGSKMKGLGWQPPKTFHQSLKKTIEWSLKNLNWINLEGET